MTNKSIDLRQTFSNYTMPNGTIVAQGSLHPNVSPYSSYGGNQNPFPKREYTKDEFQTMVDRYRQAVDAAVDSDELNMAIILGSCENPHNNNLSNFWTATHPTLPEFTAKEWTAFDAKKKVKDVLREIGLARALMHNTLRDRKSVV